MHALNVRVDRAGFYTLLCQCGWYRGYESLSVPEYILYSGIFDSAERSFVWHTEK